MGIIQDNLREFMENPDNKIVSGGSFTTKDFNDLNKIINNTEEDFLIFDNAGGKKFDIMFDRKHSGDPKIYKIKDFIESLLRDHKSWIFCYQLNKEQVILKKINYR